MRLITRTAIADVVARVIDVLMFPFVVPAGLMLKSVRRIGLQRLRICRGILMYIGVLPVRRHYYEPFLNAKELPHSLDQERHLPGIDWNLSEQLALLSSLNYESEFVAMLARTDRGPHAFHFNNGSYESGDAEYLYQLVRKIKPRTVIEIGGGQSSIIIQSATTKNFGDAETYVCEHVCIEPYEAPWLERVGVRVIRQRVEEVDKNLFDKLQNGDLLFIDSSHVIRPQGDVVTEYLEILPRLRPGVIVHLHDIFSPRDYLREWMFDKRLLWNEQYLLEGFLTNNSEWKVIAALNLLKHRHFDQLKRVCPYLADDREPASLYIQKRSAD